MRPVVWSRAAQRDVGRAYSYLAQFNPAAAQQMATELYEAVRLLAPYPYSGREVDGGRRELVAAGSYVIVYKVRTTETRILRVWHGAQDRAG